MLDWWSKFGDLRSSIEFSCEANIFCITFGSMAECNGDTSPGSLLKGNEKSLIPVGDWLIFGSGVVGADTALSSFILSKSLALEDDLADSLGI